LLAYLGLPFGTYILHSANASTAAPEATMKKYKKRNLRHYKKKKNKRKNPGKIQEKNQNNGGETRVALVALKYTIIQHTQKKIERW